MTKILNCFKYYSKSKDFLKTGIF